MDSFVDGYSTLFAGLLLSDSKVLSRLQVSDLPHGYSGQVGGSEVGVDAKGENCEVTGFVGEEFLDGADVFFRADGVYSDAVTPPRVVGVAAHDSPPCKLSN